MTFNQDTYMNDLLRLMGGENVFAHRQRRYPLEADLGTAQPEEAAGRDTRYPRLRRDEIIQADPQVILLPSEPFAFGTQEQAHLQEIFAPTEAARQGRLYLLDGSLLTWHGTRLARALNELPVVLEDLEG
jgi:ABC-type Fe3+-hydroxamate transport system substrate-binding protein